MLIQNFIERVEKAKKCTGMGKFECNPDDMEKQKRRPQTFK